MRVTRFGQPLPRVSSALTSILLDPVGLLANQAPMSLPPGGSPDQRLTIAGQGQTVYAQNFIVRDGGLTPRAAAVPHNTNPNPLGTLVTGGAEIVSSVESRFNLISGTTRFAWYSNGSYSPLSYVSSAGRSTPPSMTTADRTDICQIYEPTNDENLAIMSATSSYQTLMCWKSGTTIMSTLTQAPQARWVTAFDNFLIAGNIRDTSASSKYIQRVQWSDRGNPFSWTPGGTSLAGNEDLLDAKGSIRRVMTQESRIVIFFDNEIRVGVRGTFPRVFDFHVLDGNVGTPYGRTCVDTPRGIMFLAKDWMIYLLPKEGGPAVPIGQRAQRHIRDAQIRTTPEYSWAMYDPDTTAYQLFYTNWSSQDGSSTIDVPQDAVFLNIYDGSFTAHSWRAPNASGTIVANSTTCGWVGTQAAVVTGPTWSSVSGTYEWDTYPGSWAAAGNLASTGTRRTFMGSSAGTVFYNDPDSAADLGLSIHATWHSPMLFGDAPDRLKCVNEFRVDYRNAGASKNVFVQFSAPPGTNSGFYQSRETVALASTPLPAGTAVAFPYSTSQYPMFVLSTTARDFQLYRFWVQARVGGRAS